MVGALEKPFCARILIKAYEETEDGRWLVSGPIHDLKEDYDEETLEKSGLLKGLEMFVRMGSHVDWEHQFARTRDPEYVIGKGIRITEVDGVPWLTTQLFKGKALAQKLWKHLQEGGEAGYSLEGLAKARHPRNPKHILLTEIHRITISLSPKSYGSRLRVGPAPALATLAKSLVSEVQSGDFSEWEPVSAAPRPRARSGGEARPAPRRQTVPPTKRAKKALTTGEGIVSAGQTGGAALRAQQIAGNQKIAGNQTRSCPKCGARNRRAREKCRKCGCALRKAVLDIDSVEKASLGFDRLVARLHSAGRSLKSARALAAFIGRKK